MISKNKKLDKVLKNTLLVLLNMSNTPEEAITEIERYKKEFYFKPDYNLYMYGNALIYTGNIRTLYKEYKTMNKLEDYQVIERYKQDVGKVARYILNNKEKALNYYRGII